MGRRPCRTATDRDAFTPWRRVLCCMGRPGVRARIKAAANRWERRHVNVWDGWD